MNRWRKIIACAHAHQRFVIVTHHRPDADAAGSSLALAYWLRSLGKKVILINEDPLPEWLLFLKGAKHFQIAKDIKSLKYDAAFICDCGDVERVGQVKPLLDLNLPTINIDHHISNPRFGHMSVVDPTASSTCELVAELLDAAKMKWDLPLAQMIYAGIVTDTGSFRYDITSSKTLALASRLLALGVNPSVMYDALFPAIPSTDMAVLISLLHEATWHFDQQVYVVAISKKQLDHMSDSFDWKERLLSLMRLVKGVKIVLILSELNDGRVRVNLRSQCQINVANLAGRVGGGGHPKAAGTTLDKGLLKAKKTMLDIIKEVV